jgi:uncharacterized protein
MKPALPKKPFRLLSLDGGGTWALIQGKALGAIYGDDTDGWTILERFDLAVANSGGSLVLAMLLKGLTPREIVALFASPRERELIFERNGVVDRALGSLFGFGPRYHAPGKFNGLLDIFQRANGRWGKEFAALPLDLIAAGLNAERAQKGLGPFHFLITAFDFDAERSVFFRSDPNSAAAHFRGAPVPTIAGALHAATNAPVRYFNRPAQVEFSDGSAVNYWDGAVGGYNNPIMAGVIEALAGDPARRESMQVLSLGTSSTRLPVVAPQWPGEAPWVIRRKPLRGLDSVRVVSDLSKITAAMMSDRPEAAGYMAHIALGEPVATPEGAAALEGAVAEGASTDFAGRASRIVRMSPMVQPRYAGLGDDRHPRWEPYEWFAEPSSMKGKTLFERLSKLDMDAVQDGEVQDIIRLADLWLESKVPNQPVYSDDRFAPVIGQGGFAEALAAWRSLDAEPSAAPAPEPAPAREPIWQRVRAWLGRWRKRAAAAPAVPMGGVTPIRKTSLAASTIVPGKAPVD